MAEEYKSIWQGEEIDDAISIVKTGHPQFDTSSPFSVLTQANIKNNVGSSETDVMSQASVSRTLLEFSSILETARVRIVEVSTSGAVSLAINPNTYYKFMSNQITSLNITFNEGIQGLINEYMFQFTASSDSMVINFPSDIKWVGGTPPIFFIGRTYQFSILDKLCVWSEF